MFWEYVKLFIVLIFVCIVLFLIIFEIFVVLLGIWLVKWSFIDVILDDECDLFFGVYGVLGFL